MQQINWSFHNVNAFAWFYDELPSNEPLIIGFATKKHLSILDNFVNRFVLDLKMIYSAHLNSQGKGMT